MQVLGLCWVGTRTDAYDETAAFFAEVVGLEVLGQPGDFAVLGVPDGSTLEVFGPDSPWNAHLTSPAAGFLVADLDEAERELREAGTPIVLPVSGGEGRRWLHFRAPDGHVYELVEQD